MKQKILRIIALSSLILLGLIPLSKAQVFITGPSCVMAGTVYLYNFQGKKDATPLQDLCITGGLLIDSGKSCIGNTNYSFAKITWNGGSTGSIRINTATNTNLQVTVTSPLNAGVLDSSTMAMIVDSATVPGIIICSAASGGHCAPAFSYQWQQSDNAADWSDVKASSDQNLQINSILPTTMYYRRKVVENKSGTIGYSDVAKIIVAITDAKTSQLQ